MKINPLYTELIKRTGKKISYADVAKAIGTTRQNVGYLVKNNSELSENKIKDIENYFNISLANVKEFTIPPDEDAHTREVKEFSKELKISPEALRTILKAVAIEPELMSFAAKAVLEKNPAALERFYNILKSEIQT